MITKMSHDWEAAVVTIRYDNATLTGADEAKAFAFLRAADEARAVVPEQWQADAVLAVIADEMAKRPRTDSDDIAQREADVAWLRGEQS